MRAFDLNTSAEFKKNFNLDALLLTLNQSMSVSELSYIQAFARPQWPVLFIVGAPRSGSTLFMQWLVSLQQWAYPSNFLSRFPQAPCHAALIQKMLFDQQYNYKDEFSDLKPVLPDFQSDLGKTIGVLNQNSFMHFWRYHFPFETGDYLSVEKLKKHDSQKFIRTLAGLEQIFQQPLCMKARLMNFHLEYLSQIIPNSIFVHVQREPISQAYSLLQARLRLYGTMNKWFSQRVEPFELLQTCSPYEQVAAQVLKINTAVAHALGALSQERSLNVLLSDFCAAPQAVYTQLKRQYSALGSALHSEYEGVKSFDRTPRSIPAAERFKIQAAFEKMQGFLDASN